MPRRKDKSLNLFDEEVMRPRITANEIVNRELSNAAKYDIELVPFRSIIARGTSDLFAVTHRDISDAIKKLELKSHMHVIYKRYFVDEFAANKLLDYFKERERKMKEEALKTANDKRQSSWFYSVR